MKKQEKSISLTREETMRILSSKIYERARELCFSEHNCIIELMCKEYGQSYDKEDDDWSGIYPEDYNEWEEYGEMADDGLVIPQNYETFEFWTYDDECTDVLYEYLKCELSK